MGFFSNLVGRGAPKEAPADKSHPALKRVAATLGHDIEAASDYHRQVVPELQAALDYFEAQVAAIPGSIELDAASFRRHSFAAALFPSAAEIPVAIGRSIDIKESLPPLAVGDHSHAFALLGMRTRPGDQAPGEVPVFADHTLKCPAHSVEEARTAIRDAALERLLRSYDEHLGKLREKKRLLAVEWNIGNEPGSVPAPIGGYRTVEHELVPDNMLRGLLAWLRRPGEHLQVIHNGTRVEGRTPDTHENTHLDLPLLRAADRRQWNICFARFPIREGLHALGHETRHHRYIFI